MVVGFQRPVNGTVSSQDDETKKLKTAHTHARAHTHTPRVFANVCRWENGRQFSRLHVLVAPKQPPFLADAEMKLSWQSARLQRRIRSCKLCSIFAAPSSGSCNCGLVAATASDRKPRPSWQWLAVWLITGRH